ncbi:MAG: lipoyl(octanoyl) transferase LipB [Bacteroidia bacterium]|nr:lipoyl(octanoyl) transferase LipB [Bacteroidia bacterium]
MAEAYLHDLGNIDYGSAWQMQKELFHQSIDEKLEGGFPDHHLILCEHPHVYTLGKSANQSNLLLSEAELKSKDIDVFDIERGGDITYHGPGQLVAYPIFDLEAMQIGVKKFVFNVEECIINTLKYFGIDSERIDGRIGIWIGKDSTNERKIAAIGIKVSRHITMHGLALNVNTDLSLFNNIIPCGIQDKAVCSMESELGRNLEMSDVKQVLIDQFSTIFEIKMNSI